VARKHLEPKEISTNSGGKTTAAAYQRNENDGAKNGSKRRRAQYLSGAMAAA
jgi:hypothetical protein